MLRDMVVTGGLTILMITHKFREVMAFADEVTILRRGKLAGSGKVADLTPDSMARMMIGAEELTVQPPRVGAVGEARLELSKLNALDDAGAVAVHQRLAVRSRRARSSVLPASPAMASGSWSKCWPVSATPKAARSASAATLYYASREEMRRHKMSLLPEEPLKNACVGGMSVADNIAFREFDRAPFASKRLVAQQMAFRKGRRAQDRASTRSRPVARTRRSRHYRAATCSAWCWRANSAARSRF